ncbi:MAG: hypothetical protein COB90_01365 [Hyphomicrobiales bacterium]|nr:MAG: hypothetical protein COB90_01365 [Hyphomicrobiales bacterium]
MNNLASGIPGSMPAPSITDTAVMKVFHDLEEIGPAWCKFEKTAICPVYQRFDWINSWMSHIGQPSKVSVFIVTAWQNDQLVALWPFGKRVQRGLSTLVWLGGEHSNFNFGLYNPDLLEQSQAPWLCTKVFEVLKKQSGCQCLSLNNNPASWQGFDNPLLKFSTGAATNDAFSLDLTPGFDTLYNQSSRKRVRKKRRWQERQLEELGGYTLSHVVEPNEGIHLMDIFAEQKRHRLQQQGIHNVFDDPGVVDFFNELTKKSAGSGTPLIEFYAVRYKGAVRAIYAGAAFGGQFSAYFNSFLEDELSSLSPGELLLGLLIEDRCDRNDRYFDLGVGDERYKHSWSSRRVPLFVIQEGITPGGKAITLARSKITAAKHHVRNSKKLWALAKKIRKHLYKKHA